MTLTQTVDIPEDRRVNLNFEISRDIPTGRAQVELKVIPHGKAGKTLMKKVLVDTNVALDIMLKRKDFASAKSVFEFAEKNLLQVFFPINIFPSYRINGLIGFRLARNAD